MAAFALTTLERCPYHSCAPPWRLKSERMHSHTNMHNLCSFERNLLLLGWLSETCKGLQLCPRKFFETAMDAKDIKGCLHSLPQVHNLCSFERYLLLLRWLPETCRGLQLCSRKLFETAVDAKDSRGWLPIGQIMIVHTSTHKLGEAANIVHLTL